MATIHRPRPADAVEAEDAAGNRTLLLAATFFTIAVLLHGADHLRRGADTLDADVFWLGTLAMLIEVAVVVLVCQRHRLAPLAAAVTGFSLASGYVMVHFLPARSWASDSFTSGVDVSPWSWMAATLEVAAALALGFAGLLVLRRRGGLASAARPVAGQLPVVSGIVHPVALAMLAGNLVLVAVSVAQL